MKKLIFFLFVIVNSPKLFSQWNEIADFGNNPGKLKMYSYGFTDSTKTKKPLVIVLHGCGQTAKDVAELTGWNKLADIHHFYVLYPQQQFKNNSGVCFNWFRKKDIEKGMGECESIYQMLLYMKAKYNINEKEIYITGLSAGGAMGTVMLATHPEEFKAGAIFAGGAYKIGGNAITSMVSMMGINGQKRQELMYHVISQNPSFHGKYPLIIVYQGLDDKIVHPYNADLLVTQWTGVGGGGPYPFSVDSHYYNNPNIIRSLFINPKGDTTAISYRIKTMGHQILISLGTAADKGGKAGLFGWESTFHSTYQTAIDFGLIK